MMCNKCPEPVFNITGVSDVGLLILLRHLFDTHNDHAELRATIQRAAINSGPGGWPLISDWDKIKATAGVPSERR